MSYASFLALLLSLSPDVSLSIVVSGAAAVTTPTTTPRSVAAATTTPRVVGQNPTPESSVPQTTFVYTVRRLASSLFSGLQRVGARKRGWDTRVEGGVVLASSAASSALFSPASLCPRPLGVNKRSE